MGQISIKRRRIAIRITTKRIIQKFYQKHQQENYTKILLETHKQPSRNTLAINQKHINSHLTTHPQAIIDKTITASKHERPLKNLLKHNIAKSVVQ